MDRKSRIYTGGGDRGMTSLVGGTRVSKTHPRLEAYGTIDELNAFIGLLIAEIEDMETLGLLSYIQSKLFDAGSYLATEPSTKTYQTGSRINGDSIRTIEEAIDKIDGELPKLKTFVLPGGSRSAALAHVCRTVCRRVERNVFRLNEAEKLEESLLVFLNRLSDLLFVIARKECLCKKGEEFFLENSCK